MAAAALTLSTLTACALGFNPPAQKIVKTCVLPSDQNGTLSGKWKLLPVPIAFHQGDFGPGEISAMTAAADTWNKFYADSQGLGPVIDYGGSSVRVSATPVPTDPCAMGLMQGNTYTGQIVIYRQNVWPHPGAATTMALTSFCANGSKAGQLPKLYMAYMEINYQGFFIDGMKQPDLQTIVGHEFGHMLGLYHSCDPGSTKAGQPDCNSPTLPPAYQEALMYWSFGFHSDLSGEQKRDLRANDQGRSNCLYGPQGAS